MDEALESLMHLHAEAVGEGSAGLDDGAALFVGLLPPRGERVTPREFFLRQAATAWERSTSDRTAHLIELASALEAGLRDRANPEMASKLATVIRAFANVNQPPRAACLAFGLDHDPSDQAARRWRSLAINLNNDSDAIVEATTILEALAQGFGTAGGLGEMVAADLKVCRGRVEAGEHRPEMRRLRKAIAAADEATQAFMAAHMQNGRATDATPAAVIELCDAFLEASQGSTSDVPWLALRALTLRLHNELSATETAWSLTTMALASARECPAAAATLPMLLADQRTLRAQVLQKELNAALAKKRRGVARRVLEELVTVTDDDADRVAYGGAIAKMRSARNAERAKLGFAAMVVAGLAIAGWMNDKPGYVPSAAPHSWAVNPDPATASTHSAASGNTSADAAGSTLSIGQLRWCEYRSVEFGAAKEYIEGLRADPSTDTTRFNAGVDAGNAFNQATNASCHGKNYLVTDKATVDAEISRQAADLKLQGQNIVYQAYRDAAAPQPDGQVPLSGSTPATPVPRAPAAGTVNPAMDWARILSPASTVSGAYVAGQSDRRQIEAWMASLGGATSEGAQWWAGVRSTRHPPTCSSAPADQDQAAAQAGCEQARAMFANADRRRHAEQDYRSGWNNP